MGMALKDVVKCPHCGGREIVYSCEPKCCFNHVCADCRSTFEINTQKTGEFDREASSAAKEPESGDPTTACASCESLKIAVLRAGDEPLIVCGKCAAVSRLVIEEFVAGTF
jgi:hypothetical protein